MTYNVSNGMLNLTIPYWCPHWHSDCYRLETTTGSSKENMAATSRGGHWHICWSRSDHKPRSLGVEIATTLSWSIAAVSEWVWMHSWLHKKHVHELLRRSKGLDTCYSATYMSHTRDQQRFKILVVAADWHEPMVPQHIMWPSIFTLTDIWTHGAASRHTIAPISHTRPLPLGRSYYSFPVPLRVGGWVGLSTQ